MSTQNQKATEKAKATETAPKRARITSRLVHDDKRMTELYNAIGHDMAAGYIPDESQWKELLSLARIHLKK